MRFTKNDNRDSETGERCQPTRLTGSGHGQSNPNSRATALPPTVDQWSGEWPVSPYDMINDVRLMPKPKQPKALRRSVNRKADAKRYGEAVDHFKTHRTTEPVLLNRTEPTGDSLTTADDLRRRTADGLADHLSTFADGGLTYLALREGKGRLGGSRPSEDERYDEHGDILPRPVFSLGRQPKSKLSHKRKRQLTIIREILGQEMADMLSVGFTGSEIASQVGLSESRVSRLKKLAREKCKAMATT